MITSLRILAEIAFPSITMRLWDGSGGPFVDIDGNIYRSVVLTQDALQSIESAINAEAFTLSLVLSGIDEQTSSAAYDDYLAGTVIGSVVKISIQACDKYEQPVGALKRVFTGTVANLTFADQASDTGINATIRVDVTNRFTLRKVISGVVLSDVDQRARSKVLNPAQPDDRFCERVPIYRDYKPRWPSYS